MFWEDLGLLFYYWLIYLFIQQKNCMHISATELKKKNTVMNYMSWA